MFHNLSNCLCCEICSLCPVDLLVPVNNCDSNSAARQLVKLFSSKIEKQFGFQTARSSSRLNILSFVFPKRELKRTRGNPKSVSEYDEMRHKTVWPWFPPDLEAKLLYSVAYKMIWINAFSCGYFLR